jgi:Fe-S-cluster formation regulator IscX/YfhJ
MPENNGQAIGYSVPTDVDFERMSSGDADIRLNKLLGDMRDSKHPIMVSGDPQHKDFVDYQNNLLDVKRRDADTRPEDEKILEAAYIRGLQRQQAAADKLRTEGEQKLEMMREADFNMSEAPKPEDIRPYHITAWERQLLLKDNKFDELGESLKGSIDSHVQGMFREFVGSPYISLESRARHLQIIIEDALESERAQYESARLPQLPRIMTKSALGGSVINHSGGR